MGLDGLGRVDRLVARRRIKTPMPAEHLRDVRWQTVHDGIGHEDPAEVVRGEDEQFSAGIGQAVAASALTRSLRSAVGVKARCSVPISRWNSSGIGGFQTRSWTS